MADRCDQRSSEDEHRTDVEGALEGLTAVLLAVARGKFDVRASRDYSGDPIDVLSYLVNATAEEVSHLFEQLETERRELQVARDRLVQAAKLAALGELAAGVAHELNQPLTAIGMLVDLLELHPERRVGQCRSDLERMGQAVRRMGRIVDSVRMFGRAGPLRRSFVPAERPLNDALELLAKPMEQCHIEIDKRIGDSLPVLHADEDRLHQVFVNLLTNARDALRGVQDKRDLRVTLVVERSATHVIYRVEDTGPGVAPAVAQRIFDPFFTTKEMGQGMGLGLSLSHGIILEHGGEMRYQRGDAGGAAFVVELPIAECEGAGGL